MLVYRVRDFVSLISGYLGSVVTPGNSREYLDVVDQKEDYISIQF